MSINKKQPENPFAKRVKKSTEVHKFIHLQHLIKQVISNFVYTQHDVKRFLFKAVNLASLTFTKHLPVLLWKYEGNFLKKFGEITNRFEAALTFKTRLYHRIFFTGFGLTSGCAMMK